MDDRIALVAGGTGLVGGLLIDELLGRPEWTRVIAVTRRPLGKTHPKLEERIIEFAGLDKSSPLPQAHSAFCCLGTTLKKAGSQDAFRAVDLDAVVHFARAAKAGGARRFLLVSAHGANVHSRIFYNRIKGDVEEALEGICFEGLGIARPSLLLGDRQESRSVEHVAVAMARALRPLISWIPARPIEARTVARALIAISGGPLEGKRIFDNAELFQLGA